VGAPITFSGFNNIDFNQVLNALMQQASGPLTALQDRQKALKSQISSFDALGGNVSSLRSAADALSSLSSVSTLAGLSSDNAVSVSASSDAVAGHYDVVVQELARAQVTASTSTAPDATTTVVASGGSLSIGGVAVAVTGDVTLQGLAATINATEGIGVTAAVIRTGANSHRLALTALETGTGAAFTVTNALTGGTGISFGDEDGNGVSGDSAADNAVAASDAAILLNNIPVTSASNAFEEVVPGVTLTVSAKDAGKVISVDVTPDTTLLSVKVQEFIDSYNKVLEFLNAQRVSAGSGDAASIGRDPVLRQLRNALRSELLAAHGTEVVTKLAEVGVEFTSKGTIALNRAVFDEAVASMGDEVRSLFAGPGGVFPAVETLLDEYSNGAGLFSGAKERLNRQIASMDAQIISMQSRLALQRAALQREFSEADAAMSRLNSQSGSLASLASGFQSF
jgi:flagellar hook-associated protein 2